MHRLGCFASSARSATSSISCLCRDAAHSFRMSAWTVPVRLPAWLSLFLFCCFEKACKSAKNETIPKRFLNRAAAETNLPRLFLFKRFCILHKFSSLFCRNLQICVLRKEIHAKETTLCYNKAFMYAGGYTGIQHRKGSLP